MYPTSDVQKFFLGKGKHLYITNKLSQEEVSFYYFFQNEFVYDFLDFEKVLDQLILELTETNISPDNLEITFGADGLYPTNMHYKEFKSNMEILYSDLIKEIQDSLKDLEKIAYGRILNLQRYIKDVEIEFSNGNFQFSGNKILLNHQIKAKSNDRNNYLLQLVSEYFVGDYPSAKWSPFNKTLFAINNAPLEDGYFSFIGSLKNDLPYSIGDDTFYDIVSLLKKISNHIYNSCNSWHIENRPYPTTHTLKDIMLNDKKYSVELELKSLMYNFDPATFENFLDLGFYSTQIYYHFSGFTYLPESTLNEYLSYLNIR